jgi:hypothetical protein
MQWIHDMILLGSVLKGCLETSNLTEKVLKTANFGLVLLMVPSSLERYGAQKVVAVQERVEGL